MAFVRNEFELPRPSPSTLLTDPGVATSLLDGTWYLQYTSPSTIDDDDENGDDDNNKNEWTALDAAEGDANIETKRFTAKGTVQAVGVTVETSNRLVKQIIDVAASRVTNDIALPWGHVVAGGTFRPSSRVPVRALVKFDTLNFVINDPSTSGGGDDGDGDNNDDEDSLFTIQLGFVFDLINKFRGSTENGWLETTYIDDAMRIGRGNKGTLFVLTRDP